MKSWVNWLQDSLGVRTIPKLRADGGGTGPDFCCIIYHCSNKEWLTLLKAHWSHYSQELSADTSLRQVLSEASAKCVDGTKAALRDVFLVCPAIVAEPLYVNGVALLAVENPSDVAWLEFWRLGLNTVPNLKL